MRKTLIFKNIPEEQKRESREIGKTKIGTNKNQLSKKDNENKYKMPIMILS